jgi:hypothetical protein
MNFIWVFNNLVFAFIFIRREAGGRRAQAEEIKKQRRAETN